MYCTKCGEKLEPGARFCPMCGCPVEELSEETFSGEKTSEVSSDQILVKKKHFGVAPIIIAVLVLFVIVGLGAFLFVNWPFSPDKELISSDIETGISNAYSNTISSYSYEVEDQETKDKESFLIVKIDAEGLYADFQIEGQLKYEKEENEWHLADLELTKTSYTIVRYPESETLFSEIIQDRGDEGEYSLKDLEEADDNVFLTYSEEIEESFYTYQENYCETFTYNSETEIWTWESDLRTEETSDPHPYNDIYGSYISIKEPSELSFPNIRNMMIGDSSDGSLLVSGGDFESGIEFSFYANADGSTGYRYTDNGNVELDIDLTEDSDTNRELVITGYDQSGQISYCLFDESLNTIQKEGRERLETGADYNSDCVIDELGWLNDPVAVGEQLAVFYEATGIQPVLYYKTFDPSITTVSEAESYAEEYAAQYYEESIANEDTLLVMFFAVEDADRMYGYLYNVTGDNVYEVMNEDELDSLINGYEEYQHSELSMDEWIPILYNTFAVNLMYDYDF